MNFFIVIIWKYKFFILSLQRKIISDKILKRFRFLVIGIYPCVAMM